MTYIYILLHQGFIALLMTLVTLAMCLDLLLQHSGSVLAQALLELIATKRISADIFHSVWKMNATALTFPLVQPS